MEMNKKKINVYTDLAIESRELLGNADDSEIEGVRMTIEEEENIRITWVEVLNETGSQQLNKPIGNYITIESDAMKENDLEIHERVSVLLAEKIDQLCSLKEDSVILVIGLGNRHVTPDALGPKTITKILVTRHMADTGQLPDELTGAMRQVCAVSPGVMGVTGIETAEIIKGVVEHVKPDLLVAIDALAARKTSRINTTIQMSDAGVNPGAGMGNHRTSINHKTMGVPVLALGVPTVVDAATLVNDTMDHMLDTLIAELASHGQNTDFFHMLTSLESAEKYQLITKVLNPYAGNMFVTPKEVDAVINRLTNIIANSLNMALHPGINANDINRYL